MGLLKTGDRKQGSGNNSEAYSLQLFSGNRGQSLRATGIRRQETETKGTEAYQSTV
jgi:hypothetical protein